MTSCTFRVISLNDKRGKFALFQMNNSITSWRDMCIVPAVMDHCLYLDSIDSMNTKTFVFFLFRFRLVELAELGEFN